MAVGRWSAAAGAAVVWTSVCGSALAADPMDWTGFYFGGNIGAFTGNAHVTDPSGPTLYGNDITTPGFAAGVQGGYNRQITPRWVLGVEATGDYLSSQGNNTCLQSSPFIIGSNCKAQAKEIATFTGRLGYLTEPNGRTMVYGKAGAAWMHGDFSANPNNTFTNYDGPHSGAPIEQGDPSSVSASPWGWTVGAGVEHALRSGWSVNLGYDYLHFGNISLATPQTMEGFPGGEFASVPGGAAGSISQDIHLVRLGVNYRFGGGGRPAPQPETDTVPVEAPLGWEFDAGTRFWYSWGKYQTTNGQPNSPISRLTYDHMPGQSGEIFARLDAPFKVFVKGVIGGGGISSGSMVDEDWGLVDNHEPDSYSNTKSRISGTLNYLTADIGYSFYRTKDTKIGPFVGYNRYQTSMDTFGCYQTANSTICNPYVGDNVNLVSQFDVWHSLRTGVAAETKVTDRLTIGGEIAFLPYVFLDGLDMHKGRGINFPLQGVGNGVQAELLLSYRVTESLSLGFGGRYWSMWTNAAYQTNDASNFFTVNTERYGVLAQVSYHFDTPH